MGGIDISGASLVGVELFSGLKAKDREDIATMLRGELYKSGQTVFCQCDNTQYAFFILSGGVRVTSFSRTGKEITFRDLSAGQLFGELSAIDGQARSADVVALVDSRIAVLSKAHFWKILNTYPCVNARVLKHMAGLVRLLSGRVVELSAESVGFRIRAELLRLSTHAVQENGSAVISPAPKHAELASRVSTHREAISRELSDLSRQGVIEKSGSALVINDVNCLRREIEGL